MAGVQQGPSAGPGGPPPHALGVQNRAQRQEHPQRQVGADADQRDRRLARVVIRNETCRIWPSNEVQTSCATRVALAGSEGRTGLGAGCARAAWTFWKPEHDRGPERDPEEGRRWRAGRVAARPAVDEAARRAADGSRFRPVPELLHRVGAEAGSVAGAGVLLHLVHPSQRSADDRRACGTRMPG